MSMKHPAHPGYLIKEDIEALGLSIAEAAKALGVTRQQLCRVTKGTSADTWLLVCRRLTT